jgi:hypothetical protein
MDHPIIAPVDEARKKSIDYVQEQGFFHLDSCESTLDIKIHAIFAYERFQNLSRQAYENMKPALQLATHLISDLRVLDHFLDQMQSRDGRTESTLPVYQFKEGRSLRSSAILEEWMQQLQDLSSVVTWHVQEAEKSPANLYMGITFPFSKVREAFTKAVTREASMSAPYDTEDYNNAMNQCFVDIGACQEDSLSFDGKAGEPAVLLHDFFATYFDSLPKDSGFMSNEEKICRLGAYFLLAEVLVHELAHCFNIFPEFKKINQKGHISENHADQEEAIFMASHSITPECGLSRERSMFGKSLVCFAKFPTSCGAQNWYYRKPEDLYVPELQDLASHAQKGSWGYTVNGVQYRTTSDNHHYERELVPWQWMSN